MATCGQCSAGIQYVATARLTIGENEEAQQPCMYFIVLMNALLLIRIHLSSFYANDYDMREHKNRSEATKQIHLKKFQNVINYFLFNVTWKNEKNGECKVLYSFNDLKTVFWILHSNKWLKGCNACKGNTISFFYKYKAWPLTPWICCIYLLWSLMAIILKCLILNEFLGGKNPPEKYVRFNR